MMGEPTSQIDLNTLIAAQFHELKNELGQLALSLDEAALAHPEVAGALKAPRVSSRAIIDRLVQVLTLYKQHQGPLSLNVEAHVPADFIAELAAEARSLADGRLDIQVRCDTAPPFWFFDRYLATVALMSAVHNALEFADKAVEMGACAEEGGLRLYVRDDSAGYPPHILADQGRVPGKSSRGTGLGLHFAQTIAQAHRNHGREGHLRLNNDNGAVFNVWLP
jgi:signal transduction histidine kinase